MAKISLRAYHREIETLIERGRTKDAVAHCRYILKYFPKSINTFRLLGKAYLESQRYTEGADVLQRILSAIPDDFVSQVGMSIIREDEGNLDAAIWHMERAFEAQPSNVAVQDELRRLYGRRDGVQPAKIRLTRGALVRMYARGDLYQQAIAEARMALVEQPDRVDLEMILARMYFLSGQKVSATDVATGLIDKLPFCFEANKILTETLPGTTREDEVNTYIQRLSEIDPYLPFIPEGSTSSDEAPENAVMVEYPEETAENLEVPGQLPTWAQNLGVKWDTEEEDEKLPEWMTSVAPAIPETKVPSDESVDQILAEPQSETLSEPREAEIPDWMKEAGWQPSMDEGTNSEISEEAADTLADEGEIPDWLQSLAPTDEGGEGSDVPENEEDTLWLESILTDEPTGTESEVPEGEGGYFPEGEPTAEGMPFTEEASPVRQGITDFIDDSPAEEKQPFLEQEVPFDEVDDSSAASQMGIEEPVEELADISSVLENKLDVPDWLAGIADFETDETQEEPAEEITEDTGWLNDLTDKVSEPIEAEADGVEDTSWLKALLGKSDKESTTVQELETVSETSDEGTETPSEIISEVIQEPFEEAVPAQVESEVAPFEDLELEFSLPEPEEPIDLPVGLPALESTSPQTTDDFLAEIEKSMAGDQDATQPTRLVQPPAEPLADILPPLEEELPEDIAEFFKSSAEEPLEINDEVPEMLQSILDMDEGLPPEEIEKSAVNLSENLPDAIDFIPMDSSEEMDLPDWLKESLDKELGIPQPGMEEETAISDELSTEEAVEPEIQVPEPALDALTGDEPGEPGDLDADSAIKWLESIAAKQDIGETLTPETDEVSVESLVEENLDELVRSNETEPEFLEGVSVSDEEQPAPIPGDSEFEGFYQTKGEEIGLQPPETGLEAPPEEPFEELVLPEWMAEDLAEGETSAVISDQEAFEPPSLEEIEWIKEESLTLNPDQVQEAQELEPMVLEASEELENVEEPGEVTEDEFADLMDEFEPALESAKPEIVEMPGSDAVEAEEPEEIPDWLMALADDTVQQSSAIEEPEVELPAEWLKDLEEDIPVIKEETFEQLPEAEVSPVDTGLGEPESAAIAVEDTSPIRVVTSQASSYVTDGSDLYNAQAALNSHDIDNALGFYNKLIGRGEAIDDIIHDLRDALDQFPVDVSLWQTLGDAYARNNQLQEALDAYTSAEGLLG